MHTTGVSGVGGRLSKPLCIPTRYFLSVDGSSPASQVVQRPLRACLSLVLYLTIAIHSWIDLGCFYSARVRETVAIGDGYRAHFDGACDGELSWPHERKEVKDVLLRHPRVSEVEQNLEYRPSWSLDVLVHLILDLHLSALSSRYTNE